MTRRRRPTSAELRAMADTPPDPLTEAMWAYRRRFGVTAPVTLIGIPSALYPGIAAELRAAVADGRKRTEAEIRRAVGMTLPPPGAVI